MIDVGLMLERGLVCSRIERHYKPVRYELGFDTSVHPEVDVMHREVQWFLNDVLRGVRPMRWLSLLGVSGVGKSHLARAIASVIYTVRPELGVEFWSWHSVVSKLRDGDYAISDHLIAFPFVLVLDDIGAERSSDFSRDHLMRIVEGRLNKWTVVTSNLFVDQLADSVDVRIASRLLRGHNVVCEVRDASDYSLELRRHGVLPVVRDEVAMGEGELEEISDEERAEVLEILRAFREENGI